jgi:hypothetical protein
MQTENGAKAAALAAAPEQAALAGPVTAAPAVQPPEPTAAPAPEPGLAPEPCSLCTLPLPFASAYEMHACRPNLRMHARAAGVCMCCANNIREHQLGFCDWEKLCPRS